jgi:hypothetical protein
VISSLLLSKNCSSWGASGEEEESRPRSSFRRFMGSISGKTNVFEFSSSGLSAPRESHTKTFLFLGRSEIMPQTNPPFFL